MSGLRLVDRNRSRRLSGAEIQALVADRVAARVAHNEQERERREAEQAAWRRTNAARRRFWMYVVWSGLIITASGSVLLMETAGKAGLGLVLSLALAGVATVLSYRGER